jgi:hypothetical protein
VTGIVTGKLITGTSDEAVAKGRDSVDVGAEQSPRLWSPARAAERDSQLGIGASAVVGAGRAGGFQRVVEADVARDRIARDCVGAAT